MLHVKFVNIHVQVSEMSIKFFKLAIRNKVNDDGVLRNNNNNNIKIYTIIYYIVLDFVYIGTPSI